MKTKIRHCKQKRHNKTKGFSLIELIIVIAILAVIAAIAVPNLIDNINDSRKQADISNAKLIANQVAQVIAQDDNFSDANTEASGSENNTYDGSDALVAFETDVADATEDTIEQALEAAAADMQSVPSAKYNNGASDYLFHVFVGNEGKIEIYRSGGTMLFPTPGY